jgi:hypothetical protein
MYFLFDQQVLFRNFSGSSFGVAFCVLFRQGSGAILETNGLVFGSYCWRYPGKQHSTILGDNLEKKWP